MFICLSVPVFRARALVDIKCSLIFNSIQYGVKKCRRFAGGEIRKGIIGGSCKECVDASKGFEVKEVDDRGVSENVDCM